MSRVRSRLGGKQVRQICTALLKHNGDVAKVANENGVSIITVTAIRNKQVYTKISDEYFDINTFNEQPATTTTAETTENENEMTYEDVEEKSTGNFNPPSDMNAFILGKINGVSFGVKEFPISLTFIERKPFFHEEEQPKQHSGLVIPDKIKSIYKPETIDKVCRISSLIISKRGNAKEIAEKMGNGVTVKFVRQIIRKEIYNNISDLYFTYGKNSKTITVVATSEKFKVLKDKDSDTELIQLQLPETTETTKQPPVVPEQAEEKQTKENEIQEEIKMNDFDKLMNNIVDSMCKKPVNQLPESLQEDIKKLITAHVEDMPVKELRKYTV